MEPVTEDKKKCINCANAKKGALTKAGFVVCSFNPAVGHYVSVDYARECDYYEQASAELIERRVRFYHKFDQEEP